MLIMTAFIRDVIARPMAALKQAKQANVAVDAISLVLRHAVAAAGLDIDSATIDYVATTVVAAMAAILSWEARGDAIAANATVKRRRVAGF